MNSWNNIADMVETNTSTLTRIILGILLIIMALVAAWVIKLKVKEAYISQQKPSIGNVILWFIGLMAAIIAISEGCIYILINLLL